MRIVIIGGTGLIGSKLATLLRNKGHTVLAAAPNTGVNTITGEGLNEALVGADVVVDVSNSPSFEDRAVLEFFQTSTRNLIAAEKAAGVDHHVALSIVGAERMPDSGYMRAKVAQEDLIKSSGIAYSILRSTQFFEFMERVVKETREGDVYRLPPALMQPIVSDEVVAALAEVTLCPPLNGAVEIGGPEAIAMDEIGREVLSAREDPRPILVDPHARYFGTELGAQSLTPSPGARLGKLTFGDWLRRSITPD